MKKYLWCGIDSKGKRKKGTIFAASEEHAKNMLLKKNQIATLSLRTPYITQLIQTIKAKNNERRALFFAQLALLLKSGITLIKSLSILISQPALKSLAPHIEQMRNKVVHGSSFSSSLETYSNIFGPYLVHMIRAGEQAGKLSTSLEILSQHLTRQNQLKKQITQAMFLPTITLVLALLIMIGIFLFAIPQFEYLFTSIGVPLPTTTQHILAISTFLRSNKAFIFILSIIGVLFLVNFISSHHKITQLKSKIILHLWPIHKLVILSNINHYTRVLALLINTGSPLCKSLTLACHVIQNAHLQKKLQKVPLLVEKGKSFAKALQMSGARYIPTTLITFIEVAEQSGNLGLMLEKGADFLKDELERSLHFLTTILQPLLIAFVGLIIAFLIAAVYIPLFTMGYRIS